MRSIIASLTLLSITSLAQAALVISEFGLGPDGQEFLVVANTAGVPVDLSNITVSVDNGATFNSLESTATLAVGDTAIISRQAIGAFIGSYGSDPLTNVDLFLTVAGLDFDASGESGIILSDGGSSFYSVGYGAAEGSGGYTGDLCIVDNSGGTPTTSPNLIPFSSVPEPGSAMLAGIAALGLLVRRRRVS